MSCLLLNKHSLVLAQCHEFRASSTIKSKTDPFNVKNQIICDFHISTVLTLLMCNEFMINKSYENMELF